MPAITLKSALPIQPSKPKAEAKEQIGAKNKAKVDIWCISNSQESTLIFL
jgi:hypothetical protein